jgi:hypothetical protein
MDRRNFLAGFSTAAAATAAMTAPALATKTPPPPPPVKDIVTPDDFGGDLGAAFADPRPLMLTPGKTYKVDPDRLRIYVHGKRVFSPVRGSTTGGARIECSGLGRALLSIDAHSVVIQGIELVGSGREQGLQYVIDAERSPTGWGDLDLTVTECAISGADIGLRASGQGLYLDTTWFDDTRIHVELDYPTSDAGSSMASGARRFILSGCYFQSALVASIDVVSPAIHGLQIIGCHHDAVQTFVRGYLNAATITGNTVYRLGAAGIQIEGARDTVISGNSFSGERGEAEFPTNAMGPLAYIKGTARNIAITGNVASSSRFRTAPVVVAGLLAGSAVTGNAFGRTKNGIAAIKGGKLQGVRTDMTIVK